MMWNYDGGWSWLWMGGTMLLFWAGITLLAIWTLRAITSSKADRNPAKADLNRRLAAGEISREEFDRSSKSLGQPV